MKKFLGIIVTAVLAVNINTKAYAQQYPTRPITMMVAMAAGAPTDALAREVAKELSDRLGQPVLVENMTGGGGMVATRKLINSNPDGHTLLFAMNGLISSQAMRNDPGFDVTKDMVAISPTFEGSLGIYINPSIPAKTLQEFVAYAKAQPTKLNYGTAGLGTIVHLSTDSFLQRAGIVGMVHVPYRGGAEYLPATISNNVQLSLADTTFAQPFVDAGKLRLLAVTSKQRLPLLPNVPTVEESGLPGFQATFWAGVYAPRNVPQAVVDRINGELRSILMTDDAKQRYAARGYTPLWLSLAQTQIKVKEELDRINKTIDAAKIVRQ